MATRPVLSITDSRTGPRSLRRPTLARLARVWTGVVTYPPTRSRRPAFRLSNVTDAVCSPRAPRAPRSPAGLDAGAGAARLDLDRGVVDREPLAQHRRCLGEHRRGVGPVVADEVHGGHVHARREGPQVQVVHVDDGTDRTKRGLRLGRNDAGRRVL